jgi:hypothetical protein
MHVYIEGDNAMICPIRNQFCSEHGFVHGMEAEELRAGIESLLETCPSADGAEDGLRAGLVRLLDKVDARDSLAWLDASSVSDGKGICAPETSHDS